MLLRDLGFLREDSQGLVLSGLPWLLNEGLLLILFLKQFLLSWFLECCCEDWRSCCFKCCCHRSCCWNRNLTRVDGLRNDLEVATEVEWNLYSNRALLQHSSSLLVFSLLLPNDVCKYFIILRFMMNHSMVLFMMMVEHLLTDDVLFISEHLGHQRSLSFNRVKEMVVECMLILVVIKGQSWNTFQLLLSRDRSWDEELRRSWHIKSLILWKRRILKYFINDLNKSGFSHHLILTYVRNLLILFIFNFNRKRSHLLLLWIFIIFNGRLVRFKSFNRGQGWNYLLIIIICCNDVIIIIIILDWSQSQGRQMGLQ